MLAGVLEGNPGAHDQVLHGRADEYLGVASHGSDPRCHMHRDPMHALVTKFDLTGMGTRTHLKIQ